MGKYLIGASGWRYDHWVGKFYPRGLPRSGWLEFYARHFSTVEVNFSFYRLPSQETVDNWREGSPGDFVFAVKASRYITHIKRLRDCGEAIAKFSGRVTSLGDKLGPILYQLPPRFKRDDGRLAGFLEALPRHLKHTIEFRDDSWFDEGVYRILTRYGVALCIWNIPGSSSPWLSTADFAYLRFHGSQQLYSGRYSGQELRAFADAIRGLQVSRVFAYFNNDAEGNAIDNALTLKEMLG